MSLLCVNKGCVCARACECVRGWIHIQNVYIMKNSLFLFVSAMQVQKNSDEFRPLLFPGRVILFFQLRTLTGFSFCILTCWSKGDLLYFIFLGTCWSMQGISNLPGRVGSLSEDAPNGKNWNRSGAMGSSARRDCNVVSPCPAGFFFGFFCREENDLNSAGRVSFLRSSYTTAQV